MNIPTDITLVAVVGVVVAIMSVTSKFIGPPDQIRLNAKRKSTEGVSLALYVMSFSTYALWALYGALRGDWVVFIAHGALGCVMTGIILFQFYQYRNSKKNDDNETAV